MSCKCLQGTISNRCRFRSRAAGRSTRSTRELDCLSPSTPAPHQPNQHSTPNRPQQPAKMLPHHRAHQFHNPWPEPQREQRKRQKAHESSGKNRREKIPELHFKDSGSKNENLERHRRWQHSWKHQSPELMLLKRAMNPLKSLLRNPLAQHLLAAQISNDVKRNTSQRGPQRSHHHIQQQPPVILINVQRNNCVHWHSQQRRVCERNGEHAPHPQRRQHVQHPRRVPRQNVPYSFQKRIVIPSKRFLRREESRRAARCSLP